MSSNIYKYSWQEHASVVWEILFETSDNKSVNKHIQRKVVIFFILHIYTNTLDYDFLAKIFKNMSLSKDI